jgi:hypothetical protein
MAKPRTDRTRRIPRRRYREADQLAAIMSDERTPDETREALMDAMLELSISTRVHVYTARIVREAYLCMIDARHAAQEEGEDNEAMRRNFEQMSELLFCVAGTTKEGRAVATDLWLWHARRAALQVTGDDTDTQPDVAIAPVMLPSQTNVVDLLCWRQSKPRAITRPLFSFPEK